MGVVRVNGRTVVSSKSEGVSYAFGDVCNLPDGGGPIPFVNVARSEDAGNTASTVRVNGVPIVLARSTFARSTGDEPGKEGGVISGTTQGPAMFTNYSFDVRIEGQNVPRALDPMIHNLDGAGIPNAASPAELQAAGTATDKEILCEVVCFCNWRGGKTACVRNVLATPVYRGGVRCWDPRPTPPGYPAVYVEVPYLMGSNPPTPMMTKVPSQTRKDAAGNPLPLPWGDRPALGGTRRPDIVVVKDPTKPPTRGNIKDVYEVKFPPDDWGPGQKEAYRHIAGKNPIELSPGECKCKAKQRPKEVPVPVRVRAKAPAKDPQKQEEPGPQPITQPDPGLEPTPLPVVRDPGVWGILGVLLGILWGLKPGIPVLPGAPFGPGGRPMLPGDEPPRET